MEVVALDCLLRIQEVWPNPLHWVEARERKRAAEGRKMEADDDEEVQTKDGEKKPAKEGAEGGEMMGGDRQLTGRGEGQIIGGQ